MIFLNILNRSNNVLEGEGKVLVIQWCSTFWDPMECSVHGISPGKNTGVGSPSLLQGIFSTQGSNLNLLHCRWILYYMSHQGSRNMFNNVLRAEQITPWWLNGKELACSEGDLGSIPGLKRSPGEGKGCTLQYFGLEKSKDCIVHGVTKSQKWLSNFHFRAEQIFQVRSWSNIDWVEKLS